MSPRAEGLLPAGRRPSDPLLQENLLDLYHTFNRQGALHFAIIALVLVFFNITQIVRRY
jgi:hypothetical protein